MLRARLTTLLGLGLTLAAATVSVSGAQAAPTYLSDSAYIAVSRCAGLAEGLGSDATAFNKVLADQEGARSNYIVDTAQSAKEDAARMAKSAGPDRRTQLSSERDGVCKAYVSVS